MFSKLSETYQAFKSNSGKMNYQDMYHAVKGNLGKINYQEVTSQFVGPFSIFVGAYTLLTNASDDQLRVAEEQLCQLKEVRKILDPDGYGLVVEKPEPSPMGRALLWLQQHRALLWLQQHQKSVSGAITRMGLKPTEITAEEWAEIMRAEIMFNSFNPF